MATTSHSQVVALPAPHVGSGAVWLRRSLRIVLPAIVLAALLFVWTFGPLWLHLHSYEIPTLPEDLGALGSNWGIIGPQLEVTIADALVGFLIGNLLAIVGAILFAESRIVEQSFLPVAILFQTIPIVIFGPLSFTIFSALNWGPDDSLPLIGVGTKPILAVTILITFFPTLVNMTLGLRAVDPNVHDFLRLINASRWSVLWRLRLPSSIPYLFSSFKITSTLCFVGAFVGEWTLSVNTGIGGLVKEFYVYFEYPSMWAAVIVFCLSDLVFFGVFATVERFAIPWRQER